jgi:hypothetical protein
MSEEPDSDAPRGCDWPECARAAVACVAYVKVRPTLRLAWLPRGGTLYACREHADAVEAEASIVTAVELYGGA